MLVADSLDFPAVVEVGDNLVAVLGSLVEVEDNWVEVEDSWVGAEAVVEGNSVKVVDN